MNTTLMVQSRIAVPVSTVDIRFNLSNERGFTC